jgi:hypothetical protein
MARVGLALSALESRPFSDLLEAATAADDAGFELIAVPEAWGREAFALLGYLAARTTRVRLATGIVNVYSRTPALIAMAAATLDELSDGRAVLGLGVSGARVVDRDTVYVLLLPEFGDERIVAESEWRPSHLLAFVHESREWLVDLGRTSELSAEADLPDPLGAIRR